MGARERFEQAADYINSLYSGLEDSIFKLIINALKDGDYQHVDQSDVVMWQAQQLQKIGRLNQDAVKLMAQVDGLSEDAVKDLIKFHGMQIIDEIDGQLERATKQSQPLSADVTNKLDALADQTWADLQNNVNESLVTRNYQQSAITKAYRQILTESTMATVSGATSHEDAVKHALYKVVDQGLPTRLVDKAGHNWSIDGYTHMVTTTTVNRTYNDLRLQRMQDFDMHLALMSSHPNSRPACAWIQGHVVNLVPLESDDYDPKYDSIYNHGYGEPSGTLGINCRHTLFPYVPGMNTNHQPQYDPKEAIKNGKLVQGQRARERAIRDAKKRLKVAEELGDTEMVSRTKTLIKARQAKLRDYIKETNAGHKVPILTRDYDRERLINPRHIDMMSKKRMFQFSLDGKHDVHIHTSQMKEMKADIWAENRTKKYRDAARRVDKILGGYVGENLPKIVITDSRKLPKTAAASYQQSKDVLYINSDILQDYESTQNYLKGGYFAAHDANGIIKHEMTHKRNWDKAKAEYRAHPNKYRDLDDAITQLDMPVYSYFEHMARSEPSLLRQSGYLRTAISLRNYREVVAELNVLSLQDERLMKLLKGVLK